MIRRRIGGSEVANHLFPGDNVVIDSIVAERCLAFLDGDQSALGKVADRLAELGSSEADAVRSRKTTVDINGRKFPQSLSDPYEVVYHALPDEACWGLVCDFAEHVLPLWDAYTANDPTPHNVIKVRRAWLKGFSNDEEIANACKQGWTDASAAWLASGPDEILFKARAAADAGRAASLNGDVRGSLRGAAKYAQQAWSTSLYPRPEQPEQREIDQEREWQRARVRAYLIGEVQFDRRKNAEIPTSNPAPPIRHQYKNKPVPKLLHSKLSLRRTSNIGLNRPELVDSDLGHLEFTDPSVGCWRGGIQIGDTTVLLEIVHNANIPESVLADVRKRVLWIRKNEHAIREHIRKSLEQGTFKTQIAPRPIGEVTREAIQRLHLFRLRSYRDGIDLRYSAGIFSGELFGAKQIEVTVEKGIGLKDVVLLPSTPSASDLVERLIPADAADYENSLPDQFVARAALFGYLALDDELKVLLRQAIGDVENRMLSVSEHCRAYMADVKGFLNEQRGL